MIAARLGAEWIWTSFKAPDPATPVQGWLNATYPLHPSTGKTRLRFDADSQILGWRYNTTVRPLTHELLFALVLLSTDQKQNDVIVAWPHHAWLPQGATRQHEALMLTRPLPAPKGSLLWVYAQGWGAQYGKPGGRATIAEFQATVFVEGQATPLGDWGTSAALPGQA